MKGQSLLEVEDEVLKDFEQKRQESTDERDRTQKKVFTKWVNKHLTKNGRHVEDLFQDLQNGRNLIALLEVLTQEQLPKEHGETRFHRTQNVQVCLDFLKRRHIKLVNIRPKDIVEGNGKLTLGLIWTIILNFQVSMINQRRKQEAIQAAAPQSHYTTHESMKRSTTTKSTTNGHSVKSEAYEYDSVASSQVHQRDENLSARDALLQWARRATKGYPHVNVTNFGSSWRDGLAFNAILHRYRPQAVNWQKISDQRRSARERLHVAFETADREFGISALLDPEDVDTDHPDEKSIITYVSSLYNGLPNLDDVLKSAEESAMFGESTDIVSRMRRLIGVINEKLDRILERIESVERRSETERVEVLIKELRHIVTDLDDLAEPIQSLFEDVEVLREQKHHESEDLWKEVMGLHQRRQAYLDRIYNVHYPRFGVSDTRASQSNIHRSSSTTHATNNTGATTTRTTTRPGAFDKLLEAQKWVDERTIELNNMRFVENLQILEEMFEKHKVDNRDIQDFRQTVDECIARQAEVSTEDSHEYCQLLSRLESTYQQLRDLSAGRMLDLDSLIAFIRAAQQELVWIHERETIEVARNWSDINQLDLPMLQNYYKQLLHEIEIRERQFNDVHNQGAALINQRHPASDVIDVYLRTLQTQWDWLLGLSKCLEGHLRDALNLKTFTEEAEQIEQWMQRQQEHLDKNYTRTEFTIEEGERFLRELDEIGEFLRKYQSLLLSLAERASDISPLWQRGERINKSMGVHAWCDYTNKDGIHIAANDEVLLLDNWDLINWQIRDVGGREGQVPSVVFRLPPPDARIASYLERLRQQFERLKKLWERKNHHVRYHMILNTMRQVRGWDLDMFLSIPPEQRDEIIRAVNDDTNRLLSEMDPNDPLAKRLAEELRLTNEHIANLLRLANKPKEPDHSQQFDKLIQELLRKLDEAWKRLNERVSDNVPRSLDDLEHLIHAHKQFEDDLQALDVDVSNVKELFRQIPNPTPNQHAHHDHLNNRWEDLWDLSRMYVDRLKALESVLHGLDEVSDIVKRHEITLNSFDDMPAALEKLRGVHAQLLELNMVLKQQQNIVDSLNRNVAVLRQHVSRTRFNKASHPDVDRLEDQVQQITVRWENVCAQVEERLRSAEEAQQTQMIYRSQYDEEIQWLDRVERTINVLRRPEDLRPEELQAQLDQLIHEYSQLQEHTATIEQINKEGGKFIRESRTYDIRLGQFHDNIVNLHGLQIRSQFRRSEPQPKNGAQIVTEELEALNRRLAELSSVILERKNILNVLIQNHKRKLQDGRYKEPISDLAQQAYKHLEFVEEERKRGSRIFDHSWDGSERADEEFIGQDHTDHSHHHHNNNKQKASSSSPTTSHSHLDKKSPHDFDHDRESEKLTQKIHTHSDNIHDQKVHSELNREKELGQGTYTEKHSDRHSEDVPDHKPHQESHQESHSKTTTSQGTDPEPYLEEIPDKIHDHQKTPQTTHDTQTSTTQSSTQDTQTHENVPKIKVDTAEMMTSTDGSKTQEIETQVESKQFHEQSCQSEDFPMQEKEPEPAVQPDSQPIQQQFADLHKNLLNWLEETEEMVENQKAPSSDYKVVKAQLQNHDFQTKLVDDKQESVDKLSSLASQLIPLLPQKEDQQRVEHQSLEVQERFQALVDEVHHRRQLLLDAQELANDFHRTQKPLGLWLEDASQQVTALCKVVTNKEEIEANIGKQEILKREIDAKRETFDMLVECYSQLVKIVGAEDANELDAIVRSLTTRYDELGRRCVQCGHALHGFSEDMSSFLADTDELAEWLDQIEREFERLGELPLDGQELVALSEEFAELANAISERSGSVSRIVDESREICSHTSGSEALAMSARIDRLHARYNQLLNASMQRIEVFATAIRVSDELVDLVEQLEDFMDACDDALNTLDESPIDDQLECVEGLNDELHKNSPLIDDVEEMSHQLRALSNKPDQQDVELIKRSDELRERFAAAKALVEERRKRLQMADAQGRATFDALDFWLEFFEDSLAQSKSGERPPADLEQLKELMHKQRTLNERVASERAGVRDLVAEAARVARDINSNLGAEDPQMDAKIERVRKLVEETAEAGAERLAILEQVYELCKELVPAYEELNDGMQKLEGEFQKCRPINTGQSVDDLRDQLEHNNQMLQLCRSEKQNLARFEQNIDAVVELCAREDANHLRQLCEQLRDRHAEISSAFTGRGDALEKILSENSQFSDRFEAFLASLEAAAIHSRQLDPISARPPILKRQLDENAQAIRIWEQRAPAFDAMRKQAMELLAKEKNKGSQVLDLSQKISSLDELWLEIRSNYDARDRQIRTTLPLAERFWNTSSDTQLLFKALRAELNSLPESGIEPSSMDVQKQLLDKVKTQLAAATPQFEALQKTAAELLLNVGDDSERSIVEQQLQLLDQEWQMLSQSFAQRANRLGMAHDKATQYWQACQLLDQWLAQADNQLQQIGQDTTNPQTIRVAIDQLQTLRSTLNGRALERDDLNRIANELCVNAQPQQVAAIRAPLHAVGEHFNRLYALVGERQHRLERALLDLGQFEQAHAQLHSWTVETAKALDQLHNNANQISDSDAKKLEIEMAKLGVLKRDISAHVPSFEALERAALHLQQAGDPHASIAVAPLLTKWNSIQGQANAIQLQLERQHAAANSRTSQLDSWAMWLSDVLAQLSANKPVGALPETVATQLADLRLLVDEVEQKRPQLERDLKEGQRRVEQADNEEEREWMKDRLQPVQHQWQQVNERLRSREAQLKRAEEDALDLARQMNDMAEWVERAEQALNIAAPISRIPSEIQKQLNEHSSFVEMAQAQRATMTGLSNRGLKVQMTCEKKDTIPIKNQLVSLKNRNERIAQRALERQKQMQAALRDASHHFDDLDKLSEFVNDTLGQLDASATQEAATGDRIRDQLDAHRSLEAAIAEKSPLYAEFDANARQLVEQAPNGEKKELAKRVEDLKTKWGKMEEAVVKRKRQLDDALVQSGKFDEALNQLLSFLNTNLPPIEQELLVGKMHGDVDTLQTLIKENDKLAQEIKSRQSALTTIRKRGAAILANESDEEETPDHVEVKEKLGRLNDEWARLERAVDKKSHLLNDALTDGVELSESSHELREQLNDFELRLRRDLQTSTDQTDVAAGLVAAADNFLMEFSELENLKKKLDSLSKSVLERAHPKAVPSINELAKNVQTHWEQVKALLEEKDTAVRDLHKQLMDHDKSMKELETFRVEKTDVLRQTNEKCEKTWDLPTIQNLLIEHAEFKDLVRDKQPQMDSIMKLVKRSSVAAEEDARASNANLSKSTTSLMAASASGTLPRKSPKSRLLAENRNGTKRQRRADQLNDAWNTLWNDTIATEDRIKERRADIEELKRLESFTFAEWRERYLAWNDSAKARISDLFRRIDKHGAGFVPRQQFIDGVLSSKFPTTRLEMEKVADEFDKNGQISSKEFMNALRYEGRNRRLLQQQQQANQHKSDPERIHNEIKKETQRCQCAHPFKINRDNSSSSTGTVRYAFGESSIKRMVRILHSTVMVRVGGGWVELASFLEKHDPCRAKGRTNLELYQGHEFMPSVTPSGAVDHMSSFQRKPSSSSASAHEKAQLLETYKQGPVIKIREKTERSIPMFKKPGSVASSRSGSATRVYSRQSSDVSIKIDGSRIPRPTSSNNLAASRPSSRASDVSELSVTTPSRIPSIRGRKTGNGSRASSSARQSPMPR